MGESDIQQRRILQLRRIHALLWLFVLAVVVLAVAAWVGSNLYWIQQRRAFLRNFDASDDLAMPRDECAAPGSLKVFGEKGRRWIYIWVKDSEQLTADERASLNMAQVLFPESEVEEVPPNYGLFFEEFYPKRDAKLKAAKTTD